MAGDQTKFQTAMMHAERFTEAENWQEANRAYRFALAEFPNNEKAIIGFGLSLFYLGEAEQAWRAFQQALKINPNNTDALQYMGDIQAEMGRPEAAAQTYTRVGTLFASQNDFETAIAAWEQALEFAPNYPDAHRNLAQALAHLGENRLAARQFLGLAAIYQQQNQLRHAAQQVEMARTLLPDEPGVQTAIQAMQQGRPVEMDMIPDEEAVEVEEEMPTSDEFDFDFPPTDDAVADTPDSPDSNEESFDFEEESEPDSDMDLSFLQADEPDVPPSAETPEEEMDLSFLQADEPTTQSDAMDFAQTESDSAEADSFDAPDLMLPEDDEEDDSIEADFSSLLLVPDDDPEEADEGMGLSSLFDEQQPAQPASPAEEEDSDPLGDFFDEDAAPPPEDIPDDDWDIFATDEADISDAGLVEAAREQALTELANIIFEGDQSGPETSVLPDGTQVSRMEINMMVIQAIDLQARGDTAEAVDRYRQVVQANAGRPSLYYNLGLLYKDTDEFKEAVKMFRMTMPDPDYRLSAMFALAQTYYQAQQYDQAINQFVEILKEIDLDTVEDDDHYDDLAEAYETVAEKYLGDGASPKMTEFVETVTHFFSRPDWQEKVEEARRRMDAITEEGVMTLAEFLESPKTEAIVTAMGATNEYMADNHLTSASEECLRAIERAPYYLPLHVRLADILIKQDLTDAAIQKYLTIADVYETRNQVDQAVGVFKKVLKFAPMDVTVRSKLIEVYLNRNKLESAIENYITLADSYYQLAQVEKALEKYNEALQLSAKSEAASRWRAQILTNTGDIYSQRFDWARAAAYLEEAHKLDPQNEQTSRQLVDLYYKQGKKSHAIRTLDGLLKVYYKEAPQKAISFLKELVVVNPEDMFLRQRLAIAYTQNGQREEAISEYDTLAEIQFNNNMRDQALKTLQTILKLKPANPDGYRQVIQQIKSGSM